MKKILVVISFISFFLHGCSSGTGITNNYNLESKNRHPDQVYVEDSAEVFWTFYPDPFSPASYKDITISGTNTFCCYINGKVEIGLLSTQNDSIVYKSSDISFKNNSGYYWIWRAKSEADLTKLPGDCYLSKHAEPLRIVIMVDNKVKTISSNSISIPGGEYCCISKKHS